MTIEYALHASLQQAVFDIVLAFAIFFAWRTIRWLPRELRWRRERRERDADELARLRLKAEQEYARRHRRKRRRRS